MGMILRKKSETATTITLEWDPVPGAVGYRFQNPANAPKWSHTFDPNRTEVKFSKPGPYKVEALGIEDAGQYPQDSPLPPETGPITISTGGTYVVNAKSTSSTPAVTVTTTQPVTISGKVQSLAGAPLIKANGAVQLTVEHLFAYGGPIYQTSGRFIETYDHKSLTVRNCTVEFTRGIELSLGQPASSVLITRNRHKNIQGNGTNPVGNFVQFRSVQNSSIEVSWNEILNEPDKSNPEDLISVYQTRNGHLHDNYFQHQSQPGNDPAQTSSQNSITLESYDSAYPTSDWTIEDNQVVDAYAIGVFAGCSDISVLDNRVVRDGKLPNGQPSAHGFEGMWIAPGGANNHAHGNVVGYMSGSKHGGGRNDGRFPGAPEGDAGEWANNTHMPSPITAATEQAEWMRWQQKLVNAGITLGA